MLSKHEVSSPLVVSPVTSAHRDCLMILLASMVLPVVAVVTTAMAATMMITTTTITTTTTTLTHYLNENLKYQSILLAPETS